MNNSFLSVLEQIICSNTLTTEIGVSVILSRLTDSGLESVTKQKKQENMLVFIQVLFTGVDDELTVYRHKLMNACKKSSNLTWQIIKSFLQIYVNYNLSLLGTNYW